MGGGSIGGGSGRSNVKNLKTYIGQNAGRIPGWLDQFMGMYGQGAQRSNALSDRLLGGKNYGAASLFRGGAPPKEAGGGSPVSKTPTGDGGIEAAGPGNMSYRAKDIPGDKPGEGDGGQGDIDGDPSTNPDLPDPNDPNRYNNPDQTLEEGSENDPTGGLIGTYEDMQKNPWQTGPNGDAETDVLGSYDWMSSGLRNADESGVYGGLGDLGGQYGDFGQQNATDRFRKAGYGGMSDTGANEWEGSAGQTYGDLEGGGLNDLEGGAAGTYGNIAGGPNAQEQSLYGASGGLANTGSAGEGGALDVYQKMAAKPGYDEPTKAAMTAEAMSTARSPFERARDRIVRANTARGNPASSAAAEIALARDEGDTISSAGRKNLIDQAMEEARQREVAGSGLSNVGQIANARRQAGLSLQANQNAQQAGQRLQGAAGQAGISRDVTGRRMGAAAGKQAVGRDIQGRVATGLEGMGAAQAAEDARKKAGLEGQQSVLGQKAAENAKQRAIASEGTKGKQGLFDTMFQRKALGTQGLQNLQSGAAGQFQTSLAGGGNLGGKTREDYTEAGNASGGL